VLNIGDAPSIVAVQPEFSVDRANLSIDGTLVHAGPANVRACGPQVIAVGDILLAKEKGLESWHECEVAKLNGDLLTLVWSGLPQSEIFTRRVWQIGLLRILEIKPC
jgi:hypothetical protein